MTNRFEKIVGHIKSEYPGKSFIALHEPRFQGNEMNYLQECIDSTFVSSVGKYVDEFELKLAVYTGAAHAVVVVNGTAALHISLIAAGVKSDEIVLTQPLSFIATCNAISYIGAIPCFLDVDKDTMGLSPQKLGEYLAKETLTGQDGKLYDKLTQKRIAACVPMHTFGHPARITAIAALCSQYNIPLIEDAAESIGSYYDNKHTGNFGMIGTFSFNGNKTITCGGGGAIITNDPELAKRIKHLTTQAKVPHKWEFVHDQIGYNYRITNLNAALACAQLEQLDGFLENKRALAARYETFFRENDIQFVSEPSNSRSNFWLNAILLKDAAERNAFLEFTNSNGVMTRPVWTLMNKLEIFRNCPAGNLDNAAYIEERLVNIPSSVTSN